MSALISESPFDRRFLEYAWDMFNSEHAEGTQCPVGTPRWPGYLGANYRAGGIVFVGTIHNENQIFPSQSVSASGKMHALRAAFKSWMNLDRYEALADASMMPHLRDAYLSAIRCWTEFPVWAMFDSLRKIAQVEWEDVAFTNIAKCAGETSRSLSCAKTFALRDFITMLKPDVVLICNDDRQVRRFTSFDGNHSLTVRFPNSTRPYPGKQSWAEVKDAFRSFCNGGNGA